MSSPSRGESALPRRAPRSGPPRCAGAKTGGTSRGRALRCPCAGAAGAVPEINLILRWRALAAAGGPIRGGGDRAIE